MSFFNVVFESKKSECWMNETQCTVLCRLYENGKNCNTTTWRASNVQDSKPKTKLGFSTNEWKKIIIEWNIRRRLKHARAQHWGAVAAVVKIFFTTFGWSAKWSCVWGAYENENLCCCLRWGEGKRRNIRNIAASKSRKLREKRDYNERLRK